MKTRKFIRQTFEERADAAGGLVIYDPERRSREIVKEVASDRCTLIDTSDSIIEAHEKAVEQWTGAGAMQHIESRFIIYIPSAPPKTDEDGRHDPFAAIAAGSDWFPRG
jgi:hypothetical protein